MKRKPKATSTMARVERAISQLIEGSPFWGTICACLERIEHAPIVTMATDGQRLLIAPQFVEGLSDAELRGVLAHEASHVALDHMGRVQERDLDLFNICADIAINNDLDEYGFKLPSSRILDRAYHGKSVEEIYADKMRELHKDQPQAAKDQEGDEQDGGQGDRQEGDNSGDQDSPSDQPDSDNQGGEGEPEGQPQEGGGGSEGDGDQPQEGENGQGAPKSGQGSPDQGEGQPQTGQPQAGAGGAPGGLPEKGHDPWRCGGVLPAPDQATSDEWKDRIITLAKVMQKAEGRLPGFIQGMVAELSKPKVSWREAMRRFVQQSMQKDYTWTRPNRRHVASGIYLPSLISDGRDRVLAVIDISGSIDESELAAFRAEAQQVLDEQACDRLTVLYCDVDVRHVDEFEHGDLITMTPYTGGGTRFSPAIKWATDNADDAACIVYFTDLACSDFGDEPAIPVLWAKYGNWPTPAPWGETIQIDAYQS